MKTITKPLVFAFCGICIFYATNTQAQTSIINTVAGNGVGSYSGNGGAATDAELHSPEGIAFDPSGNMYFADYYNNVVREVNTSGIISTFAGNSVLGYSGNGGYATAAEFARPLGVAIDASGNIYISDGNSAIRMVNTSGIISTFAGIGTSGYYGDGGPAISAELNGPFGVAIDDIGNLYIADANNNVIRMVNTGGIISTIAGNGVAGYSGNGGVATVAELYYPTGVAVDTRNNVYITDYINSVVRMVNSSGTISTFACNGTSGYSGDGGLATAAELDNPSGITVDNSGNVYISDESNNVIRMVNTSGIISTFAGNYGDGAGFSGDGGRATSAQLNGPIGIVTDGTENLYISDQFNNRVRLVKTCPAAPLPGPISGNISVCPETNQSFSITSVTGAIGYAWILPSGWTGSSTDTSIEVTIGNVSGSIELLDTNTCGNSSMESLAIVVQTPPNASICYVSVDTLSTFNEIYWDKSSLDTLAIDSFQIYRQILTNYVEVGSVAANAYTSFIDHGSTPNSNSSLYEIGVLDTCGDVGIDSATHDQTILLQASLGVGNVVNLSWNAYVGATVNYYRILRDSTGTGNWQKLDSVSSSILAYTDLHPPVSTNLQYVITTDWNLSCIPGLSSVRHGLFYSRTSYSNRKKLVVTGIPGITDISSEINIYPNPVNNALFISINQPIDGNITILNVLGQEVYTDTFNSSNNNPIKQIQLSGLSSGVYILKIESNGQTLVKKFVKI
jgi:sugar lactone lactonase YvrE